MPSLSKSDNFFDIYGEEKSISLFTSNPEDNISVQDNLSFSIQNDFKFTLVLGAHLGVTNYQ